jgi:hypothetical protein
MTPAAWIALAGAVFTLAANLAGYLVAWGVMQATVQSLAGRIGTLEREVSAFGAMKVELARIAERQDVQIEQLRDLNAAVRWMRQPVAAKP